MLRVFGNMKYTSFQWGTIIVRGQGISELARIGLVEKAIGLPNGHVILWAYSGEENVGASHLYRATLLGEEIGCPM